MDLPTNETHETAPHEASASEAARVEVGEIRASEARRRFLVPRAALVGLAAGLIAVVFRAALDGAGSWRDRLFLAAHAWGAPGILFCAVFSALGAGAGVELVRRLAPEASGSGIPHLQGVLHGTKTLRSWRVIGVKFVGGVLAISSGLLVGREGPTLQMGGAIGDILARRLGVPARDRGVLLAAGAGAGLAAAFNAPLAGLIFVLEELQRDFAPGLFAAGLVAAIVADVVGRLLTGQLPAFHVVLRDAPSLAALPIYLVLGAACAVVGVAFNRALVWGLDLFARAPKNRGGVWAAGFGALVGVLGYFAPQLLGGGHSLVETALGGRAVLGTLILFFALRFVFTIGSYGTGAAGGFFAPLLVLGAQLGLFVGLMAAHFAPGLGVAPQNFAVVGMAAIFAAAVRAPLTGIILIVEMTNGYSLILPLLVAVMSAYGAADWMGDLPIYEALIEREMKRETRDGG